MQRVILGMSAASIPAMNMEQLYVSASRAKEWIRLYTDDKEEIREAVKRSSQKLAALDLRPKPQAESRSRALGRARAAHGAAEAAGPDPPHAVGVGPRAATEAGPPGKEKERQNDKGADHGYGR